MTAACFRSMLWVVMATMCTLFSSLSAADQVVESDNTIIRYRAFIPGNVPVLRGVIIGSMGSNWDYRHFVERQAWQAAARHWGFALLGTDNNKRRAAKQGEAAVVADLQAALVSIGAQSGHLELSHATICSFGFSAGAYYSMVLAQQWPERVLAIGLGGSGPSWMPTDDPAKLDALKTVPMLLTQGDEDTLVGNDWLTAWPTWRAQGFKIALAGQWGLSHFEGNYENVMLLHFDSAIRNRLPQDWDPRAEPAQLTSLTEESGWLGDLTNCDKWRPMMPALTPASEATTSELAQRCWLIDETVGRAWQAYAPRHNSVSLLQPFADSVDYIASRELPAPHPAGTTLAFSAATRWFNKVQTVDFYANQDLIATVNADEASDNGKKFNAQWINPPAGVYAIYAVFTNQSGKRVSTKPCPLVVTAHRPAR